MDKSHSQFYSQNFSKQDKMLNIFLKFALLVLLYPNNCDSEESTSKSEWEPPAWQNSRVYKDFTLENGIKVILVDDPYTIVATGSLHIGAGSMSNPKKVQGLAHLLEHMIFHGNEKYPEPESFSKYAIAHGGQVGGATGLDYTEYTFKVLSDAVLGALDHLFYATTSPLLLESSIREEIAVVNAEHAKNIPQESHRFGELERYTANPGHPYAMFDTGNEDTLWVKPQKQGINVKQELKKYHELYYSSNLMTLAVLANLNLTTLETEVIRIFSKVKNRNTTLPSWHEKPYGPSQLGVQINLKSIDGTKYLSLEFPIPSDVEDIFSNYYKRLIGNEGRQSLLIFLKSKNLVTGIYTGVSKKYRGFQMFDITLDLTDFGGIHYEDVAVHVFEFINYLKSSKPQRWYWEESRRIDSIIERFKSKDAPDYLVSHLSRKMLQDTTDNVLGDYLNPDIVDYNVTEVSRALEFITPTNMRLYLTSSDTLNNDSLTEPHYGLNYNVLPIPIALMEAMRSATPNPNVRFPAANLYLPRKFTIKPFDSEYSKVPEIIKETEFSLIWYLRDSTYLTPKVVIRVKLFSPYPILTPLDSGLAHLMRLAMQDTLLHFQETAKDAGTTFAITDVDYGIEVSIFGFSNGIGRILYKVMEKISSITFTNETFHSAKERYRKFLLDLYNVEPCKFADIDIVLGEIYWTPKVLYQALEDLTLEGLQIFYRKFISRQKMEWFFYGNILKDEAINLSLNSENYIAIAGSRPASGGEYKWQIRDVQIPEGTSWLYKMENTFHSSTCTRVVFQTPNPNLEDLVKITILSDFMYQPAYVELRTQQQLGYDLNILADREIPYISNNLNIYVQGEHDPTFVEGRIDRFLLTFQEILADMTESEFEKRKSVLMESWGGIQSRMEMNGYTLWKEIFYGHYKFERDKERQSILNNITLSELQHFYDELVGIKPGKHRRLAIHVTQMGVNSTVSHDNDKYLEATVPPLEIVETTIGTETGSITTELSNDEIADDTGEVVTIEETNESTTIAWMQNELNEVEYDKIKKRKFASFYRVRKPKSVKESDFDFLNMKQVEITDVTSWKRKQYLFPTAGL